MKGLFILILLAAVAFAVYWACTSGGEAIQKKTQAETTGVVHNVVRSGKDVGKGAEKAFRSVDFGKR